MTLLLRQVASGAPSSANISGAPDAATRDPLTAPLAPAPGRSAGAGGAIFRRTYGTGRWVQRHIDGRILRAYHREAARSQEWDSYADDTVSYALLDRSGHPADLSDLFRFMEGLHAA